MRSDTAKLQRREVDARLMDVVCSNAAKMTALPKNAVKEKIALKIAAMM